LLSTLAPKTSGGCCSSITLQKALDPSLPCPWTHLQYNYILEKQKIFIKGEEAESNADGRGENEINRTIVKRRRNKNDREKEDGMEEEREVVERSAEVQRPAEAKEKRNEMNVNKNVKRTLLQARDKRNDRKVMVKTMRKDKEEREQGNVAGVMIPCIEIVGTNLKEVEKTVEELIVGNKKKEVKKKESGK